MRQHIKMREQTPSDILPTVSKKREWNLKYLILKDLDFAISRGLKEEDLLMTFLKVLTEDAWNFQRARIPQQGTGRLQD